MFRKKKLTKSVEHYDTQEKTIEEVFEKAKKSSDFLTFSPIEKNHSLQVSFFSTLIDKKLLQQFILPYLQPATEIKQLSDLRSIIPNVDIKISKDPNEIEKSFHQGVIALYFKNKLDEFALINIGDSRLGQRETNDTQNEFSVLGPKVGFIEDIDTNLHMLREHLDTPDLI